MSLDEGDQRIVAGLRARAHPLRLRMLSLLTGAAMSAAELARELGISQALSSYHLRQLAEAGLVELHEERSVRGGRERRYRHWVQPRIEPPDTEAQATEGEAQALFVEAIIAELLRRASARVSHPRGLGVDAELWVRPRDWEQARQAIAAASTLLHSKARRPHERGTVHVNTSVVMFAMRDGSPPLAPSRS
jgi:DNA-binding transcriptional ArsR family regulator